AANHATGSRLLGAYPDLLLFEEGDPGFFIRGEGIQFQGVLLKEWPRHIEMRALRDYERVDYEVVIGDHHFRFHKDPATLVTRLERWVRYLQGEFLPETAVVFTWQAPPQTRRMQLRVALPCSE